MGVEVDDKARSFTCTATLTLTLTLSLTLTLTLSLTLTLTLPQLTLTLPHSDGTLSCSAPSKLILSRLCAARSPWSVRAAIRA